MAYTIEQLKNKLLEFDFNYDSEIADAEVHSILSKNKSSKKIHKKENEMPKINLPEPKIKQKKEPIVLSKKDKKIKSKKEEDGLILSFIKRRNQSRVTQEMNYKKRKLIKIGSFYVKMNQLKKNKKFKKKDIRNES